MAADFVAVPRRRRRAKRLLHSRRLAVVCTALGAVALSSCLPHGVEARRARGIAYFEERDHAVAALQVAGEESAVALSNESAAIAPLVAAGAAAIVFAGASAVLDAASAHSAWTTRMDIWAEEQRHFAARAHGCTQAQLMHFRAASSQLSLGAAVQAAFRSKDGSLKVVGAQLAKHLKSSLADANRLVLHSCYRLTDKEESLVAADRKLEALEAQERSHELKEVMNTGTEMLVTLGASHVSNFTDALAVAAKTTYSVVKLIEDAPKRDLLLSTIEFLQAGASAAMFVLYLLGKTVEALLAKMGLDMANVFSDLQAIGTSVSKGELTSVALFSSIVNLLYHGTSAITDAFAAQKAAGIGTGIAVSPMVLAGIVEVHVFLLAFKETLGFAVSVRNRLQLNALLREASDVIANATSVKDRRCEDLALAQRSAQSQAQLFELVNELLQKRQETSALAHFNPRARSWASDHVHSIMKPFCKEFLAFCTELLASQPIETLRHGGLKRLAAKIRRRKARSPVTDVVFVETESEEMTLYLLGFRQKGFLGLSESGMRARVMVCRGCSTSVVLSAREGPPPKTGAELGPEYLALLGPNGQQLSLVRRPASQVAAKVKDEKVLLDLEALTYKLDKSTPAQTFRDAVAAALESKPGHEIVLTSVWDAKISHSCKILGKLFKFFCGDGGQFVQGPRHEVNFAIAVYGPAEESPREKEEAKETAIQGSSTPTTAEDDKDPSKIQAGFGYAIVTAGWECPVTLDRRDGWEHLTSPRLRNALPWQPSQVRQDLWLVEHGFEDQAWSAALENSSVVIQTRLGQQHGLRKVFDLSELDPKGVWEDLAIKMDLKTPSCRIAQVVKLPEGVRHAVAVETSRDPLKPVHGMGALGSGGRWKYAASVAIDVIDDDGMFPDGRSIDLWYLQAAAHLPTEEEKSTSKAPRKYARQLQALSRNLGCGETSWERHAV